MVWRDKEQGAKVGRKDEYFPSILVKKEPKEKINRTHSSAFFMLKSYK